MSCVEYKWCWSSQTQFCCSCCLPLYRGFHLNCMLGIWSIGAQQPSTGFDTLNNRFWYYPLGSDTAGGYNLLYTGVQNDIPVSVQNEHWGCLLIYNIHILYIYYIWAMVYILDLNLLHHVINFSEESQEFILCNELKWTFMFLSWVSCLI